MVADDVICEESEILEKVIQRMFEVMQMVAEFSCGYVKGSSQVLDVASTKLMITARTVGGPAYPEKMEEMNRELTKVIDDFNHAVDVEALRLAKKNGEYMFPYLVIIDSNVSCRARAIAYAAQTRRDRI